jgi:hypothetical protein
VKKWSLYYWGCRLVPVCTRSLQIFICCDQLILQRENLL